MTRNDVWIRLRSGWEPRVEDRSVGWALWQPGYRAQPWPTDELRPDFAFYLCDSLTGGGRGIVARAIVTRMIRTTEVGSPEEAYQRVSDTLFDDELTVPPEEWRASRYNGLKAGAPWPQQLTAWRVETEPVGPHLLPELAAFPRSGWLRSSHIAL